MLYGVVILDVGIQEFLPCSHNHKEFKCPLKKKWNKGHKFVQTIGDASLKTSKTRGWWLLAMEEEKVQMFILASDNMVKPTMSTNEKKK